MDETSAAETSKDDAEPDDGLEESKEIFNLSAERERDNRDNFISCVRFGRIGGTEQWPAEILKLRQDEGKPCLSINRIPAMIHQVINDTRQNKPAISVKPVDSGADRHTAEIMSGLIRHIENISNADAAYDTAVDNSASGGFGYIRIVIADTHDDSFDQDIKIERVADPLTIYGDPYSMGVDSSDWNDGFVAKLTPLNLFKKQWKGAAASDFDAAAYKTLGDPWRQGEDVLLMEHWHREEIERLIVLLSNGWVIDGDDYAEDKDLYDAMGFTIKREKQAKSYKVTQKLMTGAEILETNDWPGKYIPIIPVYGEEVVVEGKRVFRSLFQDAMDPQRNFNYWRSKASEAAALGSMNPVIGPESAFAGVDQNKWSLINRRAFPYVSIPDDVFKAGYVPTRLGNAGPDAAALQEAASASDDIKSTSGIYDAALGARSNETSGRAINARKIEGDTGTFHFADNLSRGITCLGKCLVDLIPHVYTPGRVVRILGVDGVEHHVTLGEKTPQRPPQAAAAEMAGGPAQPPMPGTAPLPLATPSPEPDQDEKPDYGAIYDLQLGKYDVVVSAGPSYTTRRQEAADQMMQFLQAFPQAAPIIGDLFADSLDWPNAPEIARRLRKMLPQQLREDGGEIPPQVQQMIEQGKQIIAKLGQALQECQKELQAAQADNQSDQMKQMNDRLKIAVDQMNAETAEYNAVTDRMEAEAKRSADMVKAFTAPVVQPTFKQSPNPAPL